MGSPFKERVDYAAVSRLAAAIAAVDPSFDAAAFIADASAPLHGLACCPSGRNRRWPLSAPGSNS